MANSRRTPFSNQQLPISNPPPAPQFQFQTPQTLFTSLQFFLKKPHAIPFLLSIFLFLTWVSLRFHRHSVSNHSPYSLLKDDRPFFKDSNANLVKFYSSSSRFTKDNRGWMINPVSLALEADLQGGAASCASIHVGEIRPGSMRGNHRHHTSNETFVIWGAKTLFRLENKAVAKGYSEVIIGADEVAVAVSPCGTAHALVNIDAVRTAFLLGCQDSVINYNSSSSDFKVWEDL